MPGNARSPGDPTGAVTQGGASHPAWWQRGGDAVGAKVGQLLEGIRSTFRTSMEATRPALEKPDPPAASTPVVGAVPFELRSTGMVEGNITLDGTFSSNGSFLGTARIEGTITTVNGPTRGTYTGTLSVESAAALPPPTVDTAAPASLTMRWAGGLVPGTGLVGQFDGVRLSPDKLAGKLAATGTLLGDFVFTGQFTAAGSTGAAVPPFHLRAATPTGEPQSEMAAQPEAKLPAELAAELAAKLAAEPVSKPAVDLARTLAAQLGATPAAHLGGSPAAEMAAKLATDLAAKLPTAKLATDVKPADTPAAGLAADLAAELAARPGMLAPRYVPEPTPFDRQIDSAIRFHFGPSVSSEGIKSGLFLGGPAWNPADLEAAKALPKSKLGTRLVPDASWFADLRGLAAAVASQQTTGKAYFLDPRFAPFELTPDRLTEIANTVGADVWVEASRVSDLPPAHSLAFDEEGQPLQGSGIAYGFVVRPQTGATPRPEAVSQSAARSTNASGSQGRRPTRRIPVNEDGKPAEGSAVHASVVPPQTRAQPTGPVGSDDATRPGQTSARFDIPDAARAAANYLKTRGMDWLAESYLRETDPYRRRKILMAPVGEADADLLRALGQLSTGTATLWSEKADVNMINALANAIDGHIDLSPIVSVALDPTVKERETNRMRAKELGINRELIPRYLTGPAKNEWMKVIFTQKEGIPDLGTSNTAATQALNLDVEGVALVDCYDAEELAAYDKKLAAGLGGS